ncbi:MAG: hypothetical protein ABIH23_07325, partial [bacterium]
FSIQRRRCISLIIPPLILPPLISQAGLSLPCKVCCPKDLSAVESEDFSAGRLPFLYHRVYRDRPIGLAGAAL